MIVYTNLEDYCGLKLKIIFESERPGFSHQRIENKENSIRLL